MIVLTKGIQRSLLMDLTTADVRYMPTSDLPSDVEEDGYIQERQDPYLYNSKLELLDVHLNKTDAEIDWVGIVKDFPDIRNIRLLLLEKEISVEEIKRIVLLFNQKVMHFGISLLNFTQMPKELLEQGLPGVKVISGHPHPEKEGYFMPQIWAVAIQFNNSFEHNAYHRDRTAIHVEFDGLRIESHEQWDVAKERIEVCCDCEMRRLCYDYRKPKPNGGSKYVYETECAYDPYSATWKVSTEEETK